MRCVCSFFIGLVICLFSGCALTESSGHVEKFDMEVKAAPEVRGAGGYQESNTSIVRLSAGAHVGAEEKERLSGITNKKGDCKGLAACDEYSAVKVDESVEASYRTGFPYLTASMDYLYKKGVFLLGWGLSANAGLLSDVLLGVNTKYFEVGLSVGAWMYLREYNYSGTEYSCTFFLDEVVFQENPFEASSDVGISFTYGGYASIFLGQFSLNYAINIYRPDPSYDADADAIQSDFDFPLVMTEYITAGYRITENWEVRLGAANTFGEFPGWHWSATGGLSYYSK